MTDIPEWIATLVGSLVLENQALRRMLAERPEQSPATTDEPER